MRVLRRTRPIALLAIACAVMLSGCRGLTDIRLPGGTAGDNPYEVTVLFDDVLNLEQQASVRVDDVAVGDVDKIRNQGFKARVTLRIKKDVVLPANTFAELRQTSLFGEKYVALGPPPPPERPVGRLAAGAVVDRSGRNPETEEVLAALSALLNGGGIAQLQTISVELSNALAGRESRVRDALRQLNTFVGALDDSKEEIVRALENLNKLAIRLAAQRGTITAALDNIPPALGVLADQREQLVRMLTSLSNLGRVSDDVIKNSRESTVAVLRNLQPILENLNEAKTNIVSSLELLPNFPFPSSNVNGIHGDYTGLYASLDLNVNDLIRGFTSPQSGGGPLAPVTPGGSDGGGPSLQQAPSGPPSLQRRAPSDGGGSGTAVPPAVSGLTGASTAGSGSSDYTSAVLRGMSK